MGIELLVIAISAVFGFLSGVGIFGALYFLNDGNFLTDSAMTLVLAAPFGIAFPFGNQRDKPLPEAYAFCGALLAAEILLLSTYFPLSVAALLVGATALSGLLLGRLARKFSLRLPGTTSRKSTV